MKLPSPRPVLLQAMADIHHDGDVRRMLADDFKRMQRWMMTAQAGGSTIPLLATDCTESQEEQQEADRLLLRVDSPPSEPQGEP